MKTIEGKTRDEMFATAFGGWLCMMRVGGLTPPSFVRCISKPTKANISCNYQFKRPPQQLINHNYKYLAVAQMPWIIPKQSGPTVRWYSPATCKPSLPLIDRPGQCWPKILNRFNVSRWYRNIIWIRFNESGGWIGFKGFKVSYFLYFSRSTL